MNGRGRRNLRRAREEEKDEVKGGRRRGYKKERKEGCLYEVTEIGTVAARGGK